MVRALGGPGGTSRRRAVAEICRREFGRDARAEDVEFVELRRQEKSVVRLARVHAAGGVVEMVEKLARTKHEARFYAFRRRMRDLPAFDIAPEVYATRVYALRPSALFFTAASYVEVCVPGSKIEREIPVAQYARTLARIGAMAALRPPIPVRPTLDADAARRFVRAARRSGFGDARLERMVGAVAALIGSARFRAVPMIPCHNDMHLHNLARSRGDPPRTVVLDWETAGMNRAGSDLDRLFPEEGDAAAETRFREALAAYGAALRRWVEVDAAGLELAAGAFALNRRIARFHRAAEPGRDRFGAALRTWRRLERAAAESASKRRPGAAGARVWPAAARAEAPGVARKLR